MNIADKLAQIATNTPAICSLLATATKSASGEVIRVGDVSAIGHKLKVSLTSDAVTDFSCVSVSRYGKNLLPYPYSSGGFTLYGITFTDNGDGTITANGTATATVNFSIQKISVNLPAGKYTFSGCPLGGGNNKYLINYAAYFNGSAIADTWETGNGATFNAPNGITQLFFACRVYQGMTVEKLVFKPQYEYGATKSDYEPYKEPQTAFSSADGTVSGLTSLSPTMTIIPDTAGVNVTCNYLINSNEGVSNKYQELTDAIKSARALI